MKVVNSPKTVSCAFPARGGKFFVEIASGLEVRISRTEAENLYRRCKYTSAFTLYSQGDDVYLFERNAWACD